MAKEVKTPRPYRLARRAEQAAGTRRSVLTAARALFLEQGYAGTTVGQIAERAGTNVDTLYASVGRKATILRELVETAISGTEQAVPAEDRGYVRAIREAPTARGKIGIYARAIAEMGPRTAPIFLALREAGTSDGACAEMLAEISERRAANMQRFAADLRGTGALRTDLTDRQVADIVWSMNGHEYFGLLVRERGWTATQFGEWLTDAWCRLLLASPRSGR